MLRKYLSGCSEVEAAAEAEVVMPLVVEVEVDTWHILDSMSLQIHLIKLL